MTPLAPAESKVRRRRRLRGRAGVMRWITVLAVLGIAWRCVRYGLGFPIWGDEAFVAINFLRRGFWGMLEPLEYGQIVPVVLMWAELGVTRLLGMSEWSLRLLPLLAAVGSVLLFRRFALVTLDVRAALMAVGIFAASYYPVRHGTELKPYAFDLLVSLILLSLAWWVYQRPQAAARWLLLAAAGVSGVWMSYPAAFVAAGIGLLLTYILGRKRSGRIAVLWIAYGLSLGGSFLAVFLTCAGPQADATWAPGSPVTKEVWGLGFPPITEPWRLPLWLLANHTGNMMAYPLGGKNGGSTLTFLLACTGAAMLWRRNRVLLLLLLGPLLFTFMAAALHRYPYGSSARLCQHFAPSICLLAGLGLATVLRIVFAPRRAPRAFVAATLVLVAIAMVGILSDVFRPYKTFADYENRRVLRELAGHTGSRDQWISFNVADADIQYADNFYRRGGHGARHRLYLHWLAPVPLLWAPAPEQVRHPPEGRTWLIVYRDRRGGFPENALSDYVRILSQTSGPPHHEVFTFADDQWMETYAFPKAQPAGE